MNRCFRSCVLFLWTAIPGVLSASTGGEAGAVRFAPEALGQDGRITLTPGFAPDGRTIYFSQSECAPIWECPQQLKRSTFVDGAWSTPEVVAQTAGDRVDFPSVSPDGRSLLFSWATDRGRHQGQNVYEDFDLYRLDLDDPDAVPIPLDEPDINRIRSGSLRTLRYVNNENAPILTRNGDLYFWTERLDGVGERDVYVALSNGRGGFLEARPMPAPINSTGRDDGAWINADGNLMLITYSNRSGEGGADLFVSTREKGGWTEPANLGPTVNSSSNDFAATITPDNERILFTSNRPVPGRPDRIAQVWTIPIEDVPVLRERLAD